MSRERRDDLALQLSIARIKLAEHTIALRDGYRHANPSYWAAQVQKLMEQIEQVQL